MKKFALGIAASVALLACGSAASAATMVDNFTFYDSAHDPIATGSFSYDSSHSGQLTYADLTSFSVTLLGATFDLADVNALTSPQDYVYFGYDTVTKTFTPAAVSGYGGDYSGILAGLGYSPNTGFFFDPLVGQADPAGTGADGVFGRYDSGAMTSDTATSFSIEAVPEPATWAMMFLGLAALGGAARVLRRKPGSAWALARS